ncbi:MAG: YkgJ family cysteine cluster protein [Planctomycetes bacterium]|nr:YkgJ family cysteine cluster protein [Planctomycetota bacterium]
MISRQPTPIIMPVVPDQRWSCRSCGRCCRALVGHLTDDERARLEEQDWKAELGVAPYVRVGRGYALNKRPDGACVFLDGENLCLIHRKCGEAAKPFACRIFPFSVRAVQHGWQVSFRFDCPRAASSEGQPIGSYRGWLGGLVGELSHRDPGVDDTANLKRALPATLEEVDSILARYTKWAKNEDLPLSIRLLGMARVTATLQEAMVEKVRGPRLAELVDLLFKGLAGKSAALPQPPTDRQKGMLRQLAFVHAEHVSLAQRRAGLHVRLRKRWEQLRSARRFLKGVGMVPPLPGSTSEVPFQIVEAVAPVAEGVEETHGLVLRYLTSRLASRSVFGAGYYGWPVFSGLMALSLSVAAAGWLARHSAARAGRESLAFGDVAEAIGMVDRAATRLPSLGTMAERARALYLSRDDGGARLLQQYSIWRDTP